MLTRISQREVASSNGFQVVIGDRHTGIRYVERDHRVIFGWTDWTDGVGDYHITLLVTGDEDWAPGSGASPLPPTRQDEIVRRVLESLAFLGYKPELAESAAWVRHGDSAIESSHGYVVTRVGPEEVRYEDRGGRAMRIAVRDEVVAAWPVLRVDLASMARWLPPYDAEPVTDQDKAVVMGRVYDALRELGARSVEFVKKNQQGI